MLGNTCESLARAAGEGTAERGSCGAGSAGGPGVWRDGASRKAVAGIRLRSVSAAGMAPHVATEGG